MRILYVEDDPHDADLTLRFFSSSAPQFQVDLVETQREAENRLSEKDYDLVLTDLKLPQGDGLGLLTHIRENVMQVAAVIITGSGDEDTVVASLRAGADDYVIKHKDYLLRLPQVLQDAYQRHQAQTSRQERPIRLLYAEHSPADIDLTRRHLNHFSPYILMDAVGLGTAVIQKLSNPDSPYDLLLLDYRLPGMHALEVLKELRQVLRLDIPVVLTTGHGDEEVALQALKLGVYDYIVKSEGYLTRLPATLENALLHARLAREQAALKRLNQELEERIEERTERLQILVDAMTGREVRMAELKKVIIKLRTQLEDAGLEPIADDPMNV